jgi:opacity protein-like surface antigen
VFAGPGIVGVNGNYSGTDDFGSFVEAKGSSVGFAASAGADIALWGPVSARLEYRYAWIDMKSDRVEKDGSETVVYPAAETDLGYSQYIFTLNFQLSDVDDQGI